jgi:sulfate transport system permease protein
VLPGFRVTLGVTLVWLAVIVVVPFSALAVKAAGAGLPALLEAAASPRVLAAVRLSFGAALLAAAANGVFGLAAAWVLTRYRFPGRRLLDSLVDVPLALPTAVAGIALTALWAPHGWFGAPLARLGIPVAFARPGVVLALVFVGIPFVVRTLQPVLEELDPEVEEAALSLGAGRLTTFRRVVLPQLRSAWITGMALAFARAVGEYGSVVFISGNLPMKTEIAPLLIVSRLEQYDVTGATALALVLLLASLAVLAVVGRLGNEAGERRT